MDAYYPGRRRASGKASRRGNGPRGPDRRHVVTTRMPALIGGASIYRLNPSTFSAASMTVVFRLSWQ
jgi:hypothetical protein